MPINKNSVTLRQFSPIAFDFYWLFFNRACTMMLFYFIGLTFSCAIQGCCFLNLWSIENLKKESKNKMNSGNCCETSSLVNDLTGTILIMITTLQFTKTAYNLYPAKYRLFIDDPMPMGASVSLFHGPTQKKTNRVYFSTRQW